MSKERKFTEKERGEICAEYRQAKDREEQVEILAQLYATSTANIRGELYAGGVYNIGPAEIIAAAARIMDGVTFGGLRNYKKEFSGIDAKTAKKIFKDYIYIPWGAECDPEAEAAKEQAKAALDFAKERGENKRKAAPINPPLADPAREFSDEEVRLLVRGVLSIQAEQFALEAQLRHEIDQKHKQAAEILAAADERMKELAEIGAKIQQGKELLQRLSDINNEEQAAAAAEKEAQEAAAATA